MATRFITRSLLITKHSSIFCFQRSFASASLSTPPSISFLRLRPLVALTANFRQALSSGTGVRGFSTRKTSSSLNDPNPNWSNRPPKETILLDGCDFEHWLVVMEKPEGDPTRDEIIDTYIKTLAKIVGSEEEARMKIYSVSTRHYFAFGALVTEELSYKLKELDQVRWVLPDSYLDVRNKDYGGEPFINGQAVPYDPKYHEEWVRNNARANERNRRNDRPRNFDRSRNFERRREMQSNGGPPNNGGPRGMPPNNMTGPLPNMGTNMPQNNMSGPPPKTGNTPPNYMPPPPNMGPNMSRPPPPPPNNMSGPPPPNMQGMQGNNMGQTPSSYNPGGPPGNFSGRPYNNAGGPGPVNAPMNNGYNNAGGPGNAPMNNGYNNAGGPGNAPMNNGYNNVSGLGNAPMNSGPGNAPMNNGPGNAPMNNGPYQYQSGPPVNNYAPNPSGAYPSYNNQNFTGRDDH